MDFAGVNTAVMDTFANAAFVIGAESIPVIFAAPGKQITGYEMEFASSSPFCVMDSAAVAANQIDNGTIGTIGAADYEVINVAPDGEGLSIITLTNA